MVITTNNNTRNGKLPSVETDGFPKGEIFHRDRQASPVETNARKIWSRRLVVEASTAEALRQERQRQWQCKLAAKAARDVEAMGIQGVEVLRPESGREALAVMTSSFGGTEKTQPVFDLEWLLGSKLRGKYDHPLRVAHMRAMMEGLWQTTLYCGGLAVGARSASTGNLDGVLLAYPQIGEGGTRGADFGTVQDSGLFGPRPAGLAAPTPPPPVDVWHARRFAFAYSDTGFSVFREMHKNFATGPHWYGVVLATNPKVQGTGVGGKLMRLLISLAEKDNVPLYLDTAGERNRKIYESIGCVTCGPGFEWNLPGDPDEPILDPLTNSPVREYGLMFKPRAAL